MPSRSVEFDVLVTGIERGERKLDSLGDAFDELRRKVERLDGTTARVKGVVKMEKDADRLGAKVRALAGHVFDATKTVVKFGSYAALAAGALGPLALATVTATTAAVRLAAALAPAAAAALPLAAGAALVTLTLQAMGEEFLKSIEPMTKAWQKQTIETGKLATRGVRPLAREFVKANFPAVAAAQERIGRATNAVVIGFGRWINSTAGVRNIRQISADTATTFERLAPHVDAVARSVVALAGRVSGVSFKTFGDLAEDSLVRLKTVLDGISGDDVQGAFDKISRGAVAVADGLRMIGDAADWIGQNASKIKQFSDALLVVAAVGAAATGAWVVALGASLLLLARHWDEAKAAVQGVGDAFAALPERFTTLQGVIDSFGVFWASVVTGFREFAADVGPTLAPTLERLESAFIKLQPAIAGTVTVLGGMAKAFLEIAGPVVGAIITGIGLVADAFAGLVLDATRAAGAMLSAFAAIFQPIATLAKKLKLPFADAFQSFVDGSRNASNRINDSMAQVKTDLARNEIDRLQRKVNSLKGKTVKTDADRRAIADSQARIAQLQGQINSVHGKSVSINVTTYYDQVNRASQNSGFGNPATGGGRAHGGPVTKGMSYIVGEQRPELFVPQQSGHIVPRVPTGFGGGGGSGNVTIVIQAPNYVGDKRDLVRALDDLRRSGRLPKAS